MTKEELQERYKKLILPENKRPFHFEKRPGATPVEAINPMCGDNFMLYVEETDEKLAAIHFAGIGCALSKASTSLLLREIEGKSKQEIRDFCTNFLAAIDEDLPMTSFSEQLQVLAELKNFDGRVDCIQLSWKALLDHLEKSK